MTIWLLWLLIQDPREQECEARRTRLVKAVKLYRMVHEGQSPEKLSDLYLEDYVRSLADFVCPVAGSRAPTRREIDTASDYVLDPAGEIREKTSHGADDKAAAAEAFKKLDLEAALAAYSRVLNKEPSFAEARLNRGQIFTVLGRYPEAIADLALASGNAAKFHLIDALIGAGRLAEADAELQKFEAAVWRGAYWMKKGDRERAAQSFAKADSGSALMLYNAAQLALNYKNHDRALLFYDCVALLDSKAYGVHYGRGSALLGLGRREQAIAAFKRYLEFDSTSEWAKKAREAVGVRNPEASAKAKAQGDAAWTAGQVSEALKQYEQALEFDPSNAAARIGRASALVVVARYSDAVSEYRRIVQAGETAHRYALVDALILAGKTDEADEELKKIESDPARTAYAPALRGQLRVKKGDRDAAARSFAEAVRADPRMGEQYYLVAHRMNEQRNYERALHLLECAELMNPSAAGIFYARGAALAGLGRKPEAVASFRRYLEFDSTSAWADAARQAIAQLER